ncbi:MAG: baseplate J/gp47 family protein [Desulfobulbaceae bacterium]|nr:baseplate J/gp47 family protein [Desulfobulbaceae bacterium]
MDYPVPSFDELLNKILTDYRGQFDGKYDTSEGSLAFIKSACTASALWGIYQHQEHIGKQIFPDTQEEENLEHYGWVQGIDRKPGESVADYLDRILDDLRRPPAGGNQYDYEKWAKEITNVKAAYSWPLAQGAESVDVVIVADAVATGDEIPTQALIDEVAAYIEEVRPVGARFVRVLAPTIVEQAVTMTGVGVDLAAAVQADIEAYLNTFEPGQELYLPQLTTIATENGVANPVLTTPAATVTPEDYEMLRPGVIDVS